jgi:L-iditol 2-dehydrogenase
MKALVFIGPGEMAVQDRPEPRPGPGDVVVAVRASGICGSDVHGYLGRTGRRHPGMVMGHEAAGEILEAGPDVGSLKAGDRVVLRSVLACGACDACRRGQSNICASSRGLGMHFDGAYAERIVVPAALAVQLPGPLTYEQGALVEPLAVALHAVSITPLEAADVVVIVGAGSIGLLTLLAIGRDRAGAVIVTDRSAHRLAVARDLGASLAIDVGTTDPVAAVQDLTGGHGADVVFEAVGISATVAQSIALARPGGQVTWIGNCAPVVELPMQEMVTRELTLRGSYAFTGEFEEAIDAQVAGRIDVRRLIERRAPLDEAPALFRELGSGALDAVKVVLLPNG